MKKIIKRNKLKLMSFFMALVMVLTNVLPLSSVIVYAENTTKDSIGSINQEDDGTNVGVDITQGQETTYSDELTNESQENTLVYVSQASTFNVIIPKVVILDGETKNASYVVGVSGNIGGMENIEVVPEDSFLMKQQGKNDITALVSQDKTSWSYDEFETKGNGSIAANDMTAGMWNGSFVFNIKLNASNNEQPTTPETPLSLSLTTDDLAMGAGEQAQVNAFYDNKDVTNLVTWESDNENIVVEDGLIETKASAKVGDTATITVSANENELNETLVSSLIDTLTFSKVVYAETGDVSIEFIVTIVDIEYSIDSISLHPGESQEITAKIIPETINDTVTWSSTAVSGINLIKNGNNLTIKVADDMETGKTYYVIATYGNYSKTLAIDIISEQPQLEAGLYDANGVMLCTWEESGIDIETDYSTSNVTLQKGSATYVIKNKYPTTTKVVLPNNITRIGDAHFYASTIVEILIPNSVTYIGEGSFASCKNLTGIKIPDSVTTLGNYCFQADTSLKEVQLSQNIKTIPQYAFTYSIISEIEIPSNVTTIDVCAFESCTNLKTVTNGENVEIIKRAAFWGNKNLTNITLSNKLTTIEKDAFNNCVKLENLKVPTTVTSIGEMAFNKVPNVIYDGTATGAPWNAKVINGYIEDYFIYKDNTKTTICGYYGDSTIVQIPTTVTTIAANAFYGSTNLTYIQIPDSVTTIEKMAFANCTGVTNITIPSSVKTIGTNAFYSVTKITYTGTATGRPWGAKSIK